MHVYDFDETIYDGDSTRDFYFYCLRKQPQIALCLPYQLWHFFLYMLGIHTKTAFKERFYSFFKRIDNMDAAVAAFWETHFCKIKPWYQPREKDVVISASPAFLLRLPCKKLGIAQLIASEVDSRTGKYSGENCYGSEKPQRFRALLGDAHIDAFYSDSLSDTTMALLADESYIVKGDRCIPWDAYRPSLLQRAKSLYFTPTFFMYLLIGVVNTVNSIGFSWLYTHTIPNALLAFAAGYCTSLLISYYLNTLLTFKCKPQFARFIKFVLSYVPNFLIQLVVVFVVHTCLGVKELIAYAIAAVIGVPVTFLLMKLFAFKKQ